MSSINQVAIGYGLYRGKRRVILTDGFRLSDGQTRVMDLRARVCQERQLIADTTFVFGSEADLLFYNENKEAGEEKVSLGVCSPC